MGKVKRERFLLQIWNMVSHAEHGSYVKKQKGSSISKEINGAGSTSGDAGIINANLRIS
jgi:hypothetical protein